MKNIYKSLIICTLVALLSVCASNTAWAGNRDRSGQAGASHLLIDPWARTSGMANAGVAEIRGLESVFSNVAGLTYITKTQFAFNRTQYLVGSNCGININALAFAQHLGKERDFGTIAVSFSTMGFGKIPVTTVAQPEGGLGTFSPSLSVIGIHYAKSFNNFIKGGISLKIINESIADLHATGFALDAGIQYITGAYEQFKIGVTLKNIGLPMSYKGDGLTYRGEISNTDVEQSLNVRSAEFEMPSLLVIGISYDFLWFGGQYASMTKDERKEEGFTREDAMHRLTLCGAFTANSYSRDIFSVGIEYGFMQYFMVRAGYGLENIGKKKTTEINENGQEQVVNTILWNSDSFFSGPSVGATAVIPLKKGNTGSRIYIDYAYRFTSKWRGNHVMGIKFTL
ncbi:MAG: PorV/PorQ family protein [Bacteroidales bacterium]|nr:PorV/PorQ family protein [Bacteroidales bacterium]